MKTLFLLRGIKRADSLQLLKEHSLPSSGLATEFEGHGSTEPSFVPSHSVKCAELTQVTPKAGNPFPYIFSYFYIEHRPEEYQKSSGGEKNQ